MAVAPDVAAQPVGGEPSTSSSIEEAKQKAKAAIAPGGTDGSSTAQNGVGGAARPLSGADSPSRKRSRSGSRISQSNGASGKARSDEAVERELLDIYGGRQQAWDDAMYERDLINEMNAATIRQQVPRLSMQRRTFLDGWRVEDGSVSDPLRPQWVPWIFPVQRRRTRRGKHIFVSRKDLAIQAEQIDELVPIRLDIEYDKFRLRDTFTWNIHDRTIPMEKFAEMLVEDFGLPMPQYAGLAQQVHMSMQEQITDFHPHLFIEEEPLDAHLPYTSYKNDDMRVNIKLNITIGPHTLIDQFEWELNNPMNLPEEFAQQLTRDLGLSGEFTTAVAHSIREQCQLFTRSLYVVGHPFDGRPIEDHELAASFCPSPLPSPFRPFQSAKDYTPYLWALNVVELEQAEKALSREERRQKRSVNRRGGPTLPDLKDRRQTNRTLLVSSILPGGVDSLEESRIYKRSLLPGKSKRGATARDFEDSDESESEESGADSPAAMSYLQQGTARTRGMRGAAAHAHAAMRSAMNRSATPESAVFHEHETRKSGRKIIRDDASSPDPSQAGDRASLIVKLRLPRQKYQQLMRNLRARVKEMNASGAASTPPRASATPVPPGSAAGFPPTSTPRGSVAPAPAGSPSTPSRLSGPGALGRVDARGPPSAEHPVVSFPRYYSYLLLV
jgi:SWI/SNF-related matrix-associated actin-dependent regulator of chromatin subfamily B member 1